MKTICSTAIVCISLGASLPLGTLRSLAQGQNTDQSMLTNVPPPEPLVSRTQQALARDTISTTWEVLEQTFYSATGVLTSRTNRYVELGAGLNYLSDPSTGQWAPSEDLIELMPDGSAAALKGPAKLYLKPNLNSPDAVRIVSADGAVFQTRPIGLFWYDPVSGKASLIAQPQDCAGELEPPNQVVYRGAFGEVGDLRVTYTKGAVESDLVLLECPQLPPGFDSATARLELWHACQPMSAPKITPHRVGADGATDDVLDFGGLWFPTGAAYWSDGSGRRAADTPAAVRVPTLSEDGTLSPVCKTWLPGTAGDVLVEAIAWSGVAPKLASLPPTPATYLPAPAQDRSSWLVELAGTPGPSSGSPALITQGHGYQPVGLVWDYQTVTGSYGDYTFTNGLTYYVYQNVSFSGNVTFNPCVIKFSSGAYILAYGSITCNGSSSLPTIFTSWQDDLFGDPIPTATSCPSYMADEALWVYYINASVTVSGMRFRWANTALRLDSGYAQAVSGCRFEFCQVGICGQYCSTTIADSTRCGVVTPTLALGESASFTGALTDVCSSDLDSDGNHVADLCEYQYFGRLGTLPGHVLGQMNTFTNGHSPGWDQFIWAGGDLTPQDLNNSYQYRTTCWVLGARGVPDQSVGISAMSWWHSGANSHQGAGTLITPRHAITVTHMVPPDGTVFRFIGKNNDSHSVTLLHAETCQHVDYCVMLFNEDLPTNTVAYVRVLPYAARYKFTPRMQRYADPCWQSASVPCVGTTQDEDAFIYDLFWLYSGQADFQHSQWFPDWGSYYYRTGHNSDLRGGDSGHPAFMLVNGELVLIGCWETLGLATWPGQYFGEINTVIADLDDWAWTTYHTNAPSGYTATLYNLSGFPDLWQD